MHARSAVVVAFVMLIVWIGFETCSGHVILLAAPKARPKEILIITFKKSK
jgi:hypothetical protein